MHQKVRDAHVAQTGLELLILLSLTPECQTAGILHHTWQTLASFVLVTATETPWLMALGMTFSLAAHPQHPKLLCP